MNCTHILGYQEAVNVYEDVMVLNVFGTAVKIKESKLKKDAGFAAKISNPQLTRLRTPAEFSPQIDQISTNIPFAKSQSQISGDIKHRFSKMGQDL